MAIGINQLGVVDARERERVTICRPHLHGASVTEVAIPESLQRSTRLETGDVVTGPREPLDAASEMIEMTGELTGNGAGGAHRREVREIPSERLVSISSINGLSPEIAGDRPAPRENRNVYERVRPNRWIPLATGENDVTGRILDFAAPLAMGCAGIIHGPHGSGLTRALHQVVRGIGVNAADIRPIVLLLRPRGEEVTYWRRSLPEADVVVCPYGQAGSAPEQTLRVADLVLEAALRQTELGRHILLAVDSFTGLWGAMLEAEEADAQREADIARARHRIRQWLQRAGDFTGEGFLGSGLGGSLTLVGTAWRREIDIEAEEEGEIHPHLRLLEHLLPEANWQVALSGELAAARLYPAIDTTHCLSRDEENILEPALLERVLGARLALAEIPDPKRYGRLAEALADSADMDSLLEALGGPAIRTSSFETLRHLLGGE